MLRTSAASVIALASATLSAQAQTVFYGEQPAPVFPPPQSFIVEPQPPVPGIVPTQPLYYESIPAVQPPPVAYEADPATGVLRPVPPPDARPQTFAPAEPLPRPQGGRILAAPPPAQPAPVQTPAMAPAPAEAAPPPAPEAAFPIPATVPQPAPEPAMTESEALRDFSDELARIVALGERYRAASPGFLDDLRALADRYAALPVMPDPPAVAEAESSDMIGPPPPPPAAETAEAPVAVPDGTQEDDGPPPVAVAVAEPAEEEDTRTALLVEEPAPEPEPASEPAMAVDPVPEPEGEPQALPQALPPTSAALVYLRDDFADGDYLANPAWTVRQGQFTVDPAFGLRPVAAESVAPAQVTPQALLQYLIGDARPAVPEPTAESGASLIEAQADIGNAFSLVATITDHGGEGAAHFILHQGGANWLGYRLELRAGPRPLVVLARRGASGYKDIMKVEAPGFTSGTPHQLRWARLADGQMFVLIDGRPIITARDTVFRQGWSGFGYFTADADISMRNIRITEPVER